MLELSGSAYSEQHSSISGVRTIQVDSLRSGVQYQVKLSKNEAQISFRGTDSLKDVATDLQFMKAVVPYANNNSKIRVHKGFITAYKGEDVRNRIHSYITEDIEKVRITGHSFGAALAMLCALDLQYNFPNKDYELAVFGCPRIGNNAFKKSFEKRLFKSVRVENGNDAVTKIPYASMGYRHAGAKLHIGSPRIFGIASTKQHSITQYYGKMLQRLK